ncbi:MAG: haloacid dehalogenase type II [Ferrovibrionaceae bacterium]
MSFSTFRALTFDVYGTLIDWEAGILAQLRPFAVQHGLGLDDEGLLSAFAAAEGRWEADHPGMPYSTLLAAVHRDLQRSWGVGPDEAAALAFGASVPEWPAFPDSAGALARLKRHFQLYALSNVDNRSIGGSLPRLGHPFDATFTAEDIGSYKPNPRNFDYALDQLQRRGIAPGAVLHVAQSLFHDHVPAAARGLANVWIDRRAGMTGQGATPLPAEMPKIGWRFDSLAAFADAVERG